MTDGLRVKMFGGFSVCWNGQYLIEHSARMNKPQELLALLLARADEKLTNEQLMEALWESDEVENPVGALKNAVYSIRKLLQKSAPGVQFIVMENGRYQWNPQIPLELDIHRFEVLTEDLFGQEKTLEEQLKEAREILTLYSGELLPGLNSRQWVIQENSYYRQKYLRTVKYMAGLLSGRGTRADLEEVLDICNRAALFEPLHEELYEYMFSAMRGLDMKQAVLSYYPVVSNLFYDELGEKLPERLRDVYLWASEGSNQIKEDLCQVQQDLSEVTKDTRPIRGAYYCEYEMFKHVYHMVARNAARSGDHVIIMLITLLPRKTELLQKQESVRYMLQLKEVIKNTLRKGDVFSRYSRNQYILMLPVRSALDVTVVQKRLKTACQSHMEKKNLIIDMKSQMLEPVV